MTLLCVGNSPSSNAIRLLKVMQAQGEERQDLNSSNCPSVAVQTIQTEAPAISPWVLSVTEPTDDKAFEEGLLPWPADSDDEENEKPRMTLGSTSGSLRPLGSNMQTWTLFPLEFCA